jgi:prepilin-type N-terminal cleavage/methylation domain-containing protein
MTRSSLPAFSLPEMLVVMVLSSIIVSIIYFSFQTISSYQVRLSNQKKSAEDAGTLYYILKKDVQQCNAVKALDDDEILCEYWAGSNVSYAFLSDYTLRTQQSRIDTFTCAFTIPVFSFEDKPVSHYPATISEIRLPRAENSTGPLNILLYKYYDAASLLDLTKTDSLP